MSTFKQSRRPVSRPVIVDTELLIGNSGTLARGGTTGRPRVVFRRPFFAEILNEFRFFVRY